MTELAPVYVDDERVRLQGDPRPSISKIVEAAGKRGGRVLHLRSQGEREGETMPPNQVIDRSRTKEPIYLRCVEDGSAQASLHGDTQFGAARTGMAGQGAQGTKERGRLGDPEATLDVAAQTKSDYVGETSGTDAPRKPPRGGGDDLHGESHVGAASAQGRDLEGGSNESYGEGDLAPGGRTGLDGARDVGVPGDAGHGSSGRPGFGSTRRLPSKSAGGVGDAPGDEGIGATNRRQAGAGTASGADDPDNQAQGGVAQDIRDQSTDHSGRQQSQH